MLLDAPARSVLNLNVPALAYDDVQGVRWARLAAFGSVRAAISESRRGRPAVRAARDRRRRAARLRPGARRRGLRLAHHDRRRRRGVADRTREFARGLVGRRPRRNRRTGARGSRRVRAPLAAPPAPRRRHPTQAIGGPHVAGAVELGSRGGGSFRALSPASAALIAAACSRGHSRTNNRTTTTSSARRLPVGRSSRPSTWVRSKASVRRSRIHTRRSMSRCAGLRRRVSSGLANDAQGVYPAEVLPVLAEGLVVLHQRCPHLGCRAALLRLVAVVRVPVPRRSVRSGRRDRAGPAPRGMSLMSASIVNGRLVLSADATFPGLPIGTDTTKQKPAGPFCVGS